MSDAIPRIAAVINPLVKKAKMHAQFPLPVWDDTGTKLGVAIRTDKKMGHQDCVAEATFTLTPTEISNPKRIEQKATLAIAAITDEVWISIRPKKVKRNAA